MNRTNTNAVLRPSRKGAFTLGPGGGIRRFSGAAVLAAFALIMGCSSGDNGADAGTDGTDTFIPDMIADTDAGISDGGEDFVCVDPCDTAMALRCSGELLEICAWNEYGCRVWQVQQDCSDSGLLCDDSVDPPICVPPPSCDDLILNQDETDVDCGGLVCPPCAVGEDCIEDRDCETEICTDELCRLCLAGSHGCFGNWLRLCLPDGLSWEDVERCDPIAGYVCNPVTGTCDPAEAIGHGPSDPTGEYYRFAHFTTEDSPFLGGADVDSLQDRIYVNRDGAHVDVYTVTLLDSDGDTVAERNQHPDNPDNTGPIEERVLAFVETYDVPIGSTNDNELYVTPDRIVFKQSSAATGDLYEYDIAAVAVTQIVDVAVGIRNQVLGWDDVNELWFTATYDRWVYSHDPIENEWVLEFIYPNLSGDHGDGFEVVTDLETGIPYVYVSDMTSDFIGQYRKDDDGLWVQENLFSYANPDAEDVEGMGFGALGHFWITNEGYGVPSGIHGLYEVGGGDMDEYLN